MAKKSFSFKKMFFTAASAACLVPLAVNKVIFMLNDASDNNKRPENEYNYSLGAVRYSRQGSKKPLLLIHDPSIYSSSIIWQKNIEKLSEDYTVYALDLLGFGYSDKPKITYTAFLYANLINDFIHDVIKRPTAICALNESCAFALAANALHPENFTRLILVSPNNLLEGFSSNKENHLAFPLELPILGESSYLLKTSRKSIKAYLCSLGLFSKELINSRLINTIYHCSHFGGSNNRYIYSSIKGGFLKSNFFLHLNKLKKPLLIIWGENNVNNPVDNMSLIKAQLSLKAEFIVFEQTRLYPQLENPTQFNKTINEFLTN